MVKITNDGVRIFEVTEGAFKSIFVHQGFQKVVDEKPKKAKEPNTDGKNDNGNGDAEFIEGLKEKPISQWSKNDIKQYAAITGLDITGTKNINEARDLVKAHMDEQAD